MRRMPVRCRGCGSWCMPDTPCPACDPVANHRFNSHEWNRRGDTPECVWCAAKIWHGAAVEYCQPDQAHVIVLDDEQAAAWGLT